MDNTGGAGTFQYGDSPNAEILGMEHLADEGGAEFAPSKAAEFDVGIDYRGPWETEWAGVQTSVRRHARALSKTGMPVWLVSHGHEMEYYDKQGRKINGFADHTELSDSVRAEVGHLLNCRHKQALLVVEHRVFSPENILQVVYPPRLGRLDPKYRRRLNATTVLYTVFERSAPDDDLKRVAFAMGNLSEVWVPCERNRQVLIACGMDPKRVVRVPHPIPAIDPVWRLRSRASVPGGRLRFINVGKWEPRKAQHELIGGFMLAFEPGQHELVIKYSDFGSEWKDYPETPQHSLQQWLQDPRIIERGWTIETAVKSFRFYGEHISREMLVRFLSESDVYVSAGRAEGFDMPALDAKILGLRMVVMGHGGAEDFATQSDVVWESPVCSVHPGYGWRGAVWSGHRPSDVALAMSLAVDREIGESRQERILLDVTPYTERAVGKQMLERCMRIVRGITPDFIFHPVEEYRDV